MKFGFLIAEGRLSQIKIRKSESGQSMAWAAVVLAFLLIPLLTMVADGGRLLSVRNQLQTATDAACEDAAWSAADFRAYRDAGTITFETNWFWIARAQNTFYQTLGNQQGTMQYDAHVVIWPDFTNAYMNCQASASVPLLVGAGLIGSPVSVTAESSSRIRFRNLP